MGRGVDWELGFEHGGRGFRKVVPKLEERRPPACGEAFVRAASERAQVQPRASSHAEEPSPGLTPACLPAPPRHPAPLSRLPAARELALWVRLQGEFRRRSLLPAEAIKRFEAIGVEWESQVGGGCNCFCAEVFFSLALLGCHR